MFDLYTCIQNLNNNNKKSLMHCIAVDADKAGTLALTSKGTGRKTGKKKIPIKLLTQTKKDAIKVRAHNDSYCSH